MWDTWFPFNKDLEGIVYHPYLDTRFFPTTGMGNLIATDDDFVSLPWIDSRTGEPASPVDKRLAWHALNATKALAKFGGAHPHWRKVTPLVLSHDSVSRLCRARLVQSWRRLCVRLPELDSFPADAQMALLSWAWGVGENAHYPKMVGALERKDFAAAAREIDMNPRKGTINLRNARNRALMTAAATSQCPDEITCDWKSVVADKP